MVMGSRIRFVLLGGADKAPRPRHDRPAGTRNGGRQHGPDGGAMKVRTSVWHSRVVEVCHTPVATGARGSTLELRLPPFDRWAANRRRHG